MPMGGNPGAVSAGAAALGGLAGPYTAGGENVRSAGGQMASGWTGDAATGARQSIEQLGMAYQPPAEVLRAAQPALTTYATALTAAQLLYAQGEALLSNPYTAAEGQAMMAQATMMEQQANMAAATQIQGLTSQLTGRPPESPPAPPEKPDDGWSWSDIGHAVLDGAGLVPGLGELADGANAVWYAAEGDYLNAGLSAAAMIPFAGDGVTAAKWGAKGLKAGDEALAGAKALSKGEPVDMGTGHVFLPETDVELPGALPLVLRRTYHSRWRAGRFFGPSWASTLDVHLEVGEDEVRFAGDDAFVLTFPLPDGWPVPAVQTPRRRLHRDAEGWTVADLDDGRTLHFGEEIPGPGGPTHWLVAITDRAGHRIDVVRDPDGAPHEVRHSGGYRMRVRIVADRVIGFDLRGAGPDGAGRALVRFGYGDEGVTAAVNSSNLPLRYSYDAQYRLTGWVDRNGTWFRHEYDERDRVVRQSGSADALAASYTYDDDAATIARADSQGRVTRYVHDERFRVVREIDPLGNERTLEWTEDNLLARDVDPLGRASAYAYDADGGLVAVTAPDGGRTVVERDALGLPRTVVDADGARTEYEHDHRGLRLATTDPAGARTAYDYDEAGRLTAVTDALGGVATVTTDGAGLVTAVTDPAGHTTTWTRNAFGRVVAEIDPTGARTEYAWTVEGRLASRTDPAGGVERRLYDGEGNLVAHTDPAGGLTRYEYGAFDQVSARVDPDGSRTEYTHDSELRLVRVTDPLGLSWSYEHDAAGRLVAETDFDGRRRGFTRDAAGQVVASTNALGQVVEYDHDAAGRLVERRADGVLHTFDHDAAGRLVRATTPEVDVILARDATGRVRTEAIDGREVRSVYDALGRRVRRTTPTGVESAWNHDAAGRVTALLAGVPIGFDHDAAGRETRRVAGEAVLETEWSPAGPSRQRVPGVLDRSYTYRADGALAGITSPERSATFDLDARGRVTGVRRSGSPDAVAERERYAYDRAGNTIDAIWPTDSLDQAEVVGERTFTGTRIRRAGRVTYEHDAEGRLVRRTRARLSHRPDTWHYTWDALDRLVAVTTPDGVRWSYVYDALGRRVAKHRLDADEAPVETVTFAWDGATLVEQAAESPDAAAVITWDHDESGLRPVAQRERSRRAGQDEIDERFYAVVTDLVGAPTELLHPDGTTAGSATRSLWGHTTWAGDAASPLLFPGQYLDLESGLAYNLFRHYDPDTARYASLDPLGLEPAPNPATYVHDPHLWADPLGLAPCGIGGGGPLALPAPKPQWGGAFDYRHGGQMTAIEHINYRHLGDSSFNGPVSKFSPGTSVGSIRNDVDTTLTHGTPKFDTNGGATYEHDLGRTIGTDTSGNPTSRLRVHARDGQIRTAFPY